MGDATKRPSVSKRAVIAVAVSALAVALGTWQITSPKKRVYTDDAYLKADSTVIAPRVRGFIAELLVQDNQAVKAGDPLVRIDAEEFDARVESAQAELASATASVSESEAALKTLDAEESLSLARIRAAETRIQSADAQNERAAADQNRYDVLLAKGAVTVRDADHVRAAAISARSDADRSRAELTVSHSEASVIKAKRAHLTASLAQANAAVGRSKAALDLAKQDQAHTLIRAPIDGVIGARQAQSGDYVQPGSRLMTIVPIHDVYIVANFKETQIDRMRVGQPAHVEIDALPGVDLTGEVESLAPGSGSEFALLPFEPGTGNFTKIVQRVPVRVHLARGQKNLENLRPGLSATVTVQVQEE